MFRTSAFILLFVSVCNASLIDEFQSWVHNFAVKFNDESHFHNMFQTWVSNHKFIQEHNKLDNKTFTLGHNQFSGMDSVEFHEYLGYSGRVQRPESLYTAPIELTALPASVNWVTAGAVTPVKDQGQCGSCWSFSTTGALEGAYFVKNAQLVSFSEQQLVDCDNRSNGGKDMGCNGGIMDSAFTWIEKNGGLCTEASYPYVSGVTKTAGTCQKTCANVKNSKIASFVDVAPSSDSAMMTALSKQTVSIAIEADQREFQLYSSGVFTGACGTNLDHGVMVVGYGTMSSQDYYLVKNSWGTTWGANGYIYLGRGSQYNKGDGQCGMLLEASYPLL